MPWRVELLVQTQILLGLFGVPHWPQSKTTLLTAPDVRCLVQVGPKSVFLKKKHILLEYVKKLSGFCRVDLPPEKQYWNYGSSMLQGFQIGFVPCCVPHLSPAKEHCYYGNSDCNKLGGACFVSFKALAIVKHQSSVKERWKKGSVNS